MTEERAPADPDFDLSPAGCLALLWPAIPESIVAQDDRNWIEGMAAHMPAVPRIALEMRLGEDGGTIDVHQFISPTEGELRVLDRYLERTGKGHILGEKLRAFLMDWSENAGGLRDEIETIYLEWDQTGPDVFPEAPAVFLPLEGTGGKGRAFRHRDAALARIEGLRPEGATSLAALLADIRTHLPEGVTVNFVGLMLRRESPLRINLRGLRPDALPGVLKAIAWPGNVALATRHFGRLVDLADRVVIALDLDPIQPSIGFEAVLDSMPAHEPRWAAIFDYLCDEGLCAAPKRAALESLPARLYPEGAGQPWPASWLVAAALSPSHCVPWFERRVSHLKLSIAGDGTVGAKAYVSAQHFWRRKSAPFPLRPMTVSPAVRPLEAARTDAVSFLLAACGQDDFWRDFSLPNGPSDEWVTAFVGYALARAGDSRSAEYVRRCTAALLRRQRPSGGWGYNGFSPPDSDSTAWALKFLDATDGPASAARAAHGFLGAHLLPHGGFSTYAPGTAIRFAGDLPEGGDRGWRGGHLCVAANAAPLMKGALTACLLQGQDANGSWNAYWWKGNVFSTALAVEALAHSPEATEHRRRAFVWARGIPPHSGSAFDRAWLTTLLLQGSSTDVAAAETMALGLAGEQLADGSWAPGAAMLFPSPGQKVRDPSDVPVLDERRVFTTASALIALGAALRGQPS